MSPRRLVFIAIALLAAGATIFIGRAWLSAGRQVQVAQPVAPPEKPATQVLVARGDLHVGQFLRAENLRWQTWPDDAVAQSYVRQGDHQLEDYVGAVVRSSLADGEPITDLRVVRPGDRGFLAAVLTPGTRAVTVPVTPASSVAGFIFPGDHVDVIASFTLTDPKQGKDDTENRDHHASETVLTDIRVLALDQRADDQNKDVTVAKTATLEVTPKQAEIIAVVSEIGKLSLSLRSLGREEDEVTGESAAEGGGGKLSYTFDSDATHLTRPPIFAGSVQTVTVVRGADAKPVEFLRGAQR
jgi:pilus assembly protein CpaB